MKEFQEIKNLDNGLKFYKSDLHLHFPILIQNESENYDEGISINEIIDELIKNKYKIVSIGHHNSIESIKQLLEYIKNNEEKLKEIIILPSIELNLKEKIHLIILFPPNINFDGIRDFVVQNCGLSAPITTNYDDDVDNHLFENTKSTTETSIFKIAESCRQRGFIIIGPHARTDSGFFKLSSDEQTKLIESDLINILSCYDLPQYYLTERKDLKERIALIDCTDAHKLSDIGTSSTWIKMDYPRYKSLQQIIYEPSLRVSREEPSSKIKSKIIGLSIDGGKLKNQKIHLNENYNAIIGGTGSGKSSLIDIIKYIFNKFGFNDKFKSISLKRLKDIHCAGTKFNLYCLKEDHIFKISREVPTLEKIDQTLKKGEIDTIIENLPSTEIYQLIDNNFQPVEKSIDEVINPIIYGQNELLDYSFEPDNLIKIFNSKVDQNVFTDYIEFHKKLQKESEILDILEGSYDKLENIISDIDETNTLIDTNKTKLKNINEKFPLLEIYNNERKLLDNLDEKLENFFINIDIFKKEIKFKGDLFELEDVEHREEFEKINQEINKIINFPENYKEFLKSYTNSSENIKGIHQNLLKIYDEYEEGFKNYCKEENLQNSITINDYIKEQEIKLQGLEKEKEEINRKIKNLEEEKKNII